MGLPSIEFALINQSNSIQTLKVFGHQLFAERCK